MSAGGALQAADPGIITTATTNLSEFRHLFGDNSDTQYPFPKKKACSTYTGIGIALRVCFVLACTRIGFVEFRGYPVLVGIWACYRSLRYFMRRESFASLIEIMDGVW